MFDRNALKYGTIPVVNDLCRNHGWKVAYVALQREGYLDVAIKKI